MNLKISTSQFYKLDEAYKREKSQKVVFQEEMAKNRCSLDNQFTNDLSVKECMYGTYIFMENLLT